MGNTWRADTDQHIHFCKKQEEKPTRIHSAVHSIAVSSVLGSPMLQGEPFVWSLLVVFSQFS